MLAPASSISFINLPELRFIFSSDYFFSSMRCESAHCNAGQPALARSVFAQLDDAEVWSLFPGSDIVLWYNGRTGGVRCTVCLRAMTRTIRTIVARSWYRQLLKKSTATVIVVDDDASVRRALRTQLQILGFHVLDFQSAEEFLTSEFPTGDACLLLDVYMPGMNGVELCRSLAASGRHLPTILISGRDDRQTRQMMRDGEPDRELAQTFR